MSRAPRILIALWLGTASVGCGDDGTATSTGAGGAGGSGSTSGSGGSGTTSGAGGAIACGTQLTCTGSDVCIEEVYEPTNCTSLMPPDVACPGDKLQTFCGGAGEICCCDAPAPSTFTCDAGAGCGATVDCTCLTCPMGKQCIAVGSETSGMFRCEEPPKP
jgi:hypothetical protein